jgi:hypothetical protein
LAVQPFQRTFFVLSSPFQRAGAIGNVVSAGCTFIVVDAHTIGDCKAATLAEVRPTGILLVGRVLLLGYFIVVDVRVILLVFEFLVEFHDAPPDIRFSNAHRLPPNINGQPCLQAIPPAIYDPSRVLSRNNQKQE